MGRSSRAPGCINDGSRVRREFKAKGRIVMSKKKQKKIEGEVVAANLEYKVGQLIWEDTRIYLFAEDGSVDLTKSVKAQIAYQLHELDEHGPIGELLWANVGEARHERFSDGQLVLERGKLKKHFLFGGLEKHVAKSTGQTWWKQTKGALDRGSWGKE